MTTLEATIIVMVPRRQVARDARTTRRLTGRSETGRRLLMGRQVALLSCSSDATEPLKPGCASVSQCRDCGAMGSDGRVSDERQRLQVCSASLQRASRT
ncbi:hypothetical protein CHU98_g8844 [Xylaria longipes]|nr:hypothetical protein CHU98_g8844 [Xylaria longipes]